MLLSQEIERRKSKSLYLTRVPVFLESISPCQASAPLSNAMTAEVREYDQIRISRDMWRELSRWAQLALYEDEQCTFFHAM